MDGSKEGGYPIERRPLRQWILKITAYADRLIQDLDLIDWPESLKNFKLTGLEGARGQKCISRKRDGEAITVFTTWPDTLFGATYMVLAPEHPLVMEIVTAEQKAEVEAYRKKVPLRAI